MLSIEILDYNGQFRLSYTFEREITRPVEEYAGMSLRWAVDPASFTRTKPTSAECGSGGRRRETVTQQRAEITLAFHGRLSLSTSSHFCRRRRGKGACRRL